MNKYSDLYSDPEYDAILKGLKEKLKKYLVSKETALAALVRAGLVTEDGKPTPFYAPYKVVHCKRADYDVYIGRPSKWGNTFSHKEGTKAQFKVDSREEAVQKYEEWILEQPELLADLKHLKGKTLGCWCSPKACHGDVLLRLANPSPPTT